MNTNETFIVNEKKKSVTFMQDVKGTRYIGVANTAPEDEFDVAFGKRLAAKRADLAKAIDKVNQMVGFRAYVNEFIPIDYYESTIKEKTLKYLDSEITAARARKKDLTNYINTLIK